jgi:hypothetical protein
VTVSTQDKIAAVDQILDDLRNGGLGNGHLIEAMKAIAVDLRAETPKEIGKTLRAMTHQVEYARRTRRQQGAYDHGTMQTITEALCGRWWPVIERALQQFEKEKASV